VLPAIGDLLTHYAVFHNPQGSTAVIGLVAMPLWNLVLLMPAGGALGWLIDLRAHHAGSNLTESPAESP
jgi:hypothetical protein